MAITSDIKIIQWYYIVNFGYNIYQNFKQKMAITSAYNMAITSAIIIK